MMIYFLAFVILWSPPAFSVPLECASSLSNPPNYEQIDHTHCLVNDISTLYLNDRFSDVVLDVDNELLHAHGAVLASRSNYFRGLLYGGYDESQKSKVKISGISVTSFKVLLEYIYTGQMNLRIIEDEVILELFHVSDLFGFPILQLTLSKYLRNYVNVHNACSLFALARLYEHRELVVESLNFIDTHADDVLQSEDFLSLSPEALLEILNRDSLYANELDIFRAVFRWIKRNAYSEDSGTNIKVLSAVRYSLISDDELLSEVMDSQLVTLDTISDARQSYSKLPPHEPNVRGQSEPNVNFIHTFQVTQVIDETDSSTMIKLDHPLNINYIEMVLTGEHVEFYCYNIEVSMDQRNWVRVIDHSNFNCRSTQRLWFHPRIVRYIRIVGIKNTIDETFRFLKVQYNTKEMHSVEIKKGLVAPKYNVASISMNATLIKGENNSSCYYVLDGNYEHYCRYHGYTWHRVGSGYILVQLAQPYMLSSMRLLLWDCDDRVFSYIIEVSVNNEDWEMVVDKSKESTRSWQLLQFEPRPIVYIRITGVHTSETEFFSCVHLEAPAQVALGQNVFEVNSAEANL